MAWLRRVGKSGKVTRTITLTIPEDLFLKIWDVAGRERIPASRVLRGAVEIGCGIILKEYRKMDAGMDNSIDTVRKFYQKDGRLGVNKHREG